jgi:branched-chain amino acid transport system ATP-binding protein
MTFACRFIDRGAKGIFCRWLLAAITEIRHSRTTVLIVEQRLTEYLEIANRAYVLQSGRVMLNGTAAEVSDSAAVRQAYLGIVNPSARV